MRMHDGQHVADIRISVRPGSSTFTAYLSSPEVLRWRHPGLFRGWSAWRYRSMAVLPQVLLLGSYFTERKVLHV